MVSAEYMAGFFDGEGCVTFLKNSDGIYVVAHLTNNDRRVLDEMREKFGGCVYTRLRVNEHNRKTTYSWQISGAKAIPFLKWIDPYVVIKKPQLHVAFFWNRIRPGKQSRWNVWNPKFAKLVEDALRKLNHRGRRKEVS